MARQDGQRLTLQEGLRGSDNSFGIIRLVLASSVIFSHAFYLGGWSEDPTKALTKGQETIGGLAVVGFFVVSGYLITKSGARTDLLQFLWHRSLRIFPAFIAVLVVTAALVGPAIWLDMGRPFSQYWTASEGGPLTYVTSNILLEINQWGIHDLLAGTTPYGGALNGSLWTLAYEWRSYMVVAALLAVGVLRTTPQVVHVVTATVFALNVGFQLRPDLAVTWYPWLATKETLTLSLAFMIGASAAVLGHRIVLRGSLAAVAALVAAVTLLVGAWVLVGYAAFAYVIFYLAARLPAWWRRIGARNDYSYGMYVYGFLVQQVTAYLGWHLWGYLPWVLATLVISGICAWLSWHLVEKRALALKKLGPGRGFKAISTSISQRVAALREGRKAATA